jgi:hypothetical protein
LLRLWKRLFTDPLLIKGCCVFVHFAVVAWQRVFMPQYYTAMWDGFMFDDWAARESTVMELLKKNFTSWSMDT